MYNSKYKDKINRRNFLKGAVAVPAVAITSNTYPDDLTNEKAQGVVFEKTIEGGTYDIALEDFRNSIGAAFTGGSLRYFDATVTSVRKGTAK